MPTPVAHLFIAQQILQTDLAGRLNGQAGSYLLGSTAPDAWSVSNITRRDAHLLPIPIPPKKEGARELLARYPRLRCAAELTPAQAAFVAGYMAHLLTDEIWYHQIFDPYFSQPRPGDPDLQRRLLWHNVLRLHCESELLERLDAGLSEALARSEARYNFPLLSDDDLRRWRDLISAEARPGAPKRSAEIFAARMRISVQELRNVLDDSDALRRDVLGRLPAGLLSRVMERSLERAGRLTRRYLAGGGLE